MVEPAELAKRATCLRNAPTPFEKIIWKHLSRSQLGGYKFRRQQVIGNFIVEFATPGIGHILKSAGCDFVLLGSVATEKYVEPLLKVFGDRLLFPSDFVGRGDMSRGGLMLRCARSGAELPYVPLLGAAVHGKRPPKLPKLKRN